MELLTKPGSIGNRLLALNPTHISVAYVGLGWQKYINKDALKEIVLAPTFGSNAVAIRQLIAHLGIDHVHFLDHLHAKVFWSSTKALVGSSNLSDNGLQGDGGLIEAGVVVSDHAQLRQLKRFFGYLVAEADGIYDTPGKKYKKVNKLEALNQQASLGRLLRGKGSTNREGVSVAEFEVNDGRRIHVYPYETDLKIKKARIRQVIPGKSKAAYEAMYDNIMGFLPTDDIRKGDWILSYESNLSKAQAKPNGAIDWMYVDHVVQEGSATVPYTTVAIQERVRKDWEAPFILNARTKKAIRAVSPEARFRSLYDLSPKKMGLQVIDSLTKPFIRAVQKVHGAS